MLYFSSTRVARKILLQQNQRNTKIVVTFITIVLHFNAVTYQWRILLRRSGPAEGYILRSCTVPLDLTPGSVYATVKSMNILFCCRSHVRCSTFPSHNHFSPAPRWWLLCGKVRRLRGAETADRWHPLQGLLTTTSVKTASVMESPAHRTAKSKTILNKTVGTVNFMLDCVCYHFTQLPEVEIGA